MAHGLFSPLLFLQGKRGTCAPLAHGRASGRRCARVPGSRGRVSVPGVIYSTAHTAQPCSPRCRSQTCCFSGHCTQTDCSFLAVCCDVRHVALVVFEASPSYPVAVRSPPSPHPTPSLGSRLPTCVRGTGGAFTPDVTIPNHLLAEAEMGLGCGAVLFEWLLPAVWEGAAVFVWADGWGREGHIQVVVLGDSSSGNSNVDRGKWKQKRQRCGS